MNWKLDPQTLGERSDYNRGCAALVGLLSRVHAQAEGSSAPSGGRAGRQEGSGRIDEGGEGSGGQGSNNQFGGGKAGKSVATPAARTYETHDLLRAIDRRDAETVLAIRDANFDLLLDLSPGGTSSSSSNVAAAGSAGGAANTPLGYCIGLGKGWEGIGIVLTGALSRFVNQLPDPEETEIDAPPLAPGNDKNRIAKRKAVKSELDPRTLARLRKVRVNLKLAIDHSLTAERTSLLASYMQVSVLWPSNQSREPAS